MHTNICLWSFIMRTLCLWTFFRLPISLKLLFPMDIYTYQWSLHFCMQYEELFPTIRHCFVRRPAMEPRENGRKCAKWDPKTGSLMVGNMPKHVPKFGYGLLSRNLRMQRQTKANVNEKMQGRTLGWNCRRGAANWDIMFIYTTRNVLKAHLNCHLWHDKLPSILRTNFSS